MAASDAATTTLEPAALAAGGRRPLRVWLRSRGWRHLVLIGAVLFALYPIAWIVSASFNTADTLAASRLIPRSTTLENYRTLFDNPLLPVDRWLWNSFMIAFVVSTVQVFVGASAAYAFSRLEWRGRRVGLLLILLIQVFPQFLAFVAIITLMQAFGDIFESDVVFDRWLVWTVFAAALAFGAVVLWRRAQSRWTRVGAGAALLFAAFLAVQVVLDPGAGAVAFPRIGLNSHLGLILVYLGGSIGVNTWLMKGFMDTIPASLDEAAVIDGANRYQIFSQIVLPLSRPVLAVVFVITFVFIYGEFILASVLLTDTTLYTLPRGLQLFVADDYNASWGALAAASLLSSLPIVAVYIPMQDQLIGGLTSGAVKG